MNEVAEVRMASWQAMVQERNTSGLSIKEWVNRQFTTKDARIKLKSLYQVIE